MTGRATAGVPSLAGEWQLDAVGSCLGLASLSELTEMSLAIEQDPDKVLIRRRMVVAGVLAETAFVLCTDGAEHQLYDGSRRVFATAMWSGDVLTARFRILDADGESINVVRYRTRDAGTRLEALENFAGRTGRYENRWVLRRLGPGRPVPSITTEERR